MIKMFNSCGVQEGSHDSHVPVEHLKCEMWLMRLKMEFCILFILRVISEVRDGSLNGSSKVGFSHLRFAGRSPKPISCIPAPSIPCGPLDSQPLFLIKF